ncbi:MAG TPA: (Fe-S)-binding protein [Symbiobacteriaceae bacterium]|jgi:L-lactate dehydrogenase complex protein LldE
MRVSFFATCIVDLFFPEVGMSAVEILERQGCEVDFPPGQTCCGQPAFNCGHTAEARTLALNYLNTFRDSEYIVMPSGSCAAMVRTHYRELFADEPELKKLAEDVAARTYEFSEFLVKVLNVRDVGASFPVKAAFHSSCHLTRELKVVQEPIQLLRKVAGLELKELDRQDLCCGFGGTFAVRSPQVSANMGDDKLDDAARQDAEVLVAADMACLMHLGGRNRRRAGGMKLMHLAEVLNRREGP